MKLNFFPMYPTKKKKNPQKQQIFFPKKNYYYIEFIIFQQIIYDHKFCCHRLTPYVVRMFSIIY